MGVEGNTVNPKNEKILTPNRSTSSELKAREHDELGEADSDLSHKSNDDLIGLLENLKLEIPEEQDEEEVLKKRGKIYPSHTPTETDYLRGVRGLPHQHWDHGRIHSVCIPHNSSVQNSFASRSLPANSHKIPHYYVEGKNSSCRIWMAEHRRSQGRIVRDGPITKNKEEYVIDGPINPAEMTLPFIDTLMTNDLEPDAGPAANVLEGSAWMEGIPQIETYSDKAESLDNFDKPMQTGIIVSDNNLKKYDTLCYPPDVYDVNMYTLSPERHDEVLTMSHDQISASSSPQSIMQDENELDLIGGNGSPKQPVSPFNKSKDLSPVHTTTYDPTATWNLASEDCYISQPTPPKQQQCDWIERDMDGDSILHSCLIANVPASEFQTLLDVLDSGDILGDIINHRNESLRTALFLAVQDQKAEIVRLLLHYGADPNIQGKVQGIQDSYELRSPLHLVAEIGDTALEILRLLVDCDSTNLDIRSDSDRRTPLHLALLSHQVLTERRQERNCSETVATLLQCGANPDICEDTSSKTPIMMVIDTHDFALMKTFIDSINDHDEVRTLLEAATRGGDTPLHIAAGAVLPRESKIKLIRLLVSRGANTNVENNIKQQPEEIASRDLWKEIFRATKTIP